MEFLRMIEQCQRGNKVLWEYILWDYFLISNSRYRENRQICTGVNSVELLNLSYYKNRKSQLAVTEYYAVAKIEKSAPSSCAYWNLRFLLISNKLEWACKLKIQVNGNLRHWKPMFNEMVFYLSAETKFSII